MAKDTKRIRRGEAAQVFRQFAWNLAGTLANPSAKDRPQRRGPSSRAEPTR